jgi:hypothetical protein
LKARHYLNFCSNAFVESYKAFGGGYDNGFETEDGAGGQNSLSTKEKLGIAKMPSLFWRLTVP